jgi:hypothetical protein
VGRDEVIEVYQKIYDLALSCHGTMDESVEFKLAMGLGQILGIASMAIGLVGKDER